MRSEMSRNNRIFNYTFKINQRRKSSSHYFRKVSYIERCNREEQTTVNEIDFLPIPSIKCYPPLVRITITSFANINSANKIRKTFCKDCEILLVRVKVERENKYPKIVHKLVITEFHFDKTDSTLFIYEVFLKDTLIGYITRKTISKPYYEIVFRAALKILKEEDVLFENYKPIKLIQKFDSANSAKEYLNNNFKKINNTFKFKIN